MPTTATFPEPSKTVRSDSSLTDARLLACYRIEMMSTSLYLRHPRQHSRFL